jgi:hypothetical protein
MLFMNNFEFSSVIDFFVQFSETKGGGMAKPSQAPTYFQLLV